MLRPIKMNNDHYILIIIPAGIILVLRQNNFLLNINSLAKETGIFICHETHRSRILFAAHIAQAVHRKIP